MFFDGYDLYVAGGVLACWLTKFSTLPQNLVIAAETFVGMTVGSLITGFIGDRYGRGYLVGMIFGLASLAAAFAQDMPQLIICRFVQGLGLGAEIVVGYSTMTEFVPPQTRGRWLSMMAFIVVLGFPYAARPHHSELRLAPNVHHCRRRLADRLVYCARTFRIATLADPTESAPRRPRH